MLRIEVFGFCVMVELHTLPVITCCQHDNHVLDAHSSILEAMSHLKRCMKPRASL